MAGPATFEPVTIVINLVWDEEENRYQGSRAEPEGQVSHVVRETDANSAAADDVTDDANPDDAQEDAE